MNAPALKTTLTEFESAIFTGSVRHRRHLPKPHTFSYPIFMMWLKLDEMERLKQKLWQFGEKKYHWARFKRSDYLGQNSECLITAVKNKILELSNSEQDTLEGEIYFLGNLRYLGFYFSPINLYFLRQNDDYKWMLVEVSNTPWNNRHYYLVDLQNKQRTEKRLHVSPFNPMQQVYDWRVQLPDSDSDKFFLHINTLQNLASEGQAELKIFDATLTLKKNRLNQKSLNRVLIGKPVQTASIIAGIYWQAFKLFIKGLPVYRNSAGTRE